jgi:hypothetical protein
MAANKLRLIATAVIKIILTVIQHEVTHNSRYIT